MLRFIFEIHVFVFFAASVIDTCNFRLSIACKHECSNLVNDICEWHAIISQALR